MKQPFPPAGAAIILALAILVAGPGLCGENAPPPCPVPAEYGVQETPTPAGVEAYRLRLEQTLQQRYNNLPAYSGQVAKVSVVLSKPLDISLDGKMIRAEFDQLVYDNWGKRMPALEKEYYVIVFAEGGSQIVRTEPSVRVGLDLEKTYSERAPLTADPFRNVEKIETFGTTPRAGMPEWWRPDAREQP